MSEEALQIAEERREMKAREKDKDIPKWMKSSREWKGGKNKSFLNEECKDIEAKQ